MNCPQSGHQRVSPCEVLLPPSLTFTCSPGLYRSPSRDRSTDRPSSPPQAPSQWQTHALPCPFSREVHLFPGETDRICLVSVRCHRVQSGGLNISKSLCVKACMHVSRSYRYKQLCLQEGSTLSFFLSGRQTEINQALSFPRSHCQ